MAVAVVCGCVHSETKSPGKEKGEKKLKDLEASIKAQKNRADSSPISTVRILHRHHFSSELQRMSVVVDVKRKHGASASPAITEGKYCLVKGSPEAVETLLAKGKVLSSLLPCIPPPLSPSLSWFSLFGCVCVSVSLSVYLSVSLFPSYVQ